MELFASLEKRHSLPSGLLDAVWNTESARGKHMLSPAGAQGHFQFMPATAKQYGLDDPHDLTQSATAAARMYADLLKQTGGDLSKALAGYNWGIGNVQRKGMDRMPSETRNYIQKVTSAMGQPQAQQQDPWAGLMQEFSQSGAAAAKSGDADPWAGLMEEFKQPAAAPKATVATPRQAPAAMPQAVQQPASSPQQRNTLDSIGRQIGLTGRYALEGLGQAGDVVAEPINGLIRWAGGKATAPSKSASSLADSLGLPSPETKQERWVGDAARTGFGAAAPAGLAAKLAPMASSGIGKAITTGFADNVAAQIGGGAGSGAASGIAREAGANEWGQLAAGVAGGIGGGMAGNAAMRGAAKISEPVATKLGAEALPELSPRKMDDASLAQILRSKIEIAGGDWSAIPARAQKSLMADVRKAGNLEGLDAAALRRLADFRATGVTPTRGMVTLDPATLTREKNLAKIGVNSNNASLHGLAKLESDNNAKLIQQLQALEGGREVDATEVGRTLTSRILHQRDGLRSAEQAAWDAAKSSEGYKMPMQARVLGDINQALGDEAMMPFMDKNISAYIQALQQNPAEFTPQAYRNLQSQLSRAMAAGGNEAAAAGIARRVLDAAEMKPAATQIPNPQGLPATQGAAQRFAATDDLPGDAMAAIDAARRATRQAYAFEDSSPLVRKVLSDGSMGDPTRIGAHILRSTPDEAAEIARHMGGDGLQIARNAIATHIKQKALGGSSEEVGKVSQKALNSAIKSIGKEKLGIFFSPDEVEQLQRLGRVASYSQVQPAGSAVNNSNSGAAVIGKTVDALGAMPTLLRNLPLLNIGQTIDAGASWLGARAAQNVAPVIARGGSKTGLLYQPVLPSAVRGATAAGLLGLPDYAEERENRQ